MAGNNFYSIDKLVEFGMGVSIANQMVSSMNKAIEEMRVPGAGNPIEAANNVYYAVLGGKCAGPFSVSEFSHLIADKTVSKDTLVWKPGMISWEKAEDVSDVLKLVALTPPPVPTE